MPDRWTWTHEEWARIERTAQEHPHYRIAARAPGASRLTRKVNHAMARSTALELRQWAHVAGSIFSNELIGDLRRMEGASQAAGEARRTGQVTCQ